jgi:hypothetical protein
MILPRLMIRPLMGNLEVGLDLLCKRNCIDIFVQVIAVPGNEKINKSSCDKVTPHYLQKKDSITMKIFGQN